MTHPCHTTIQYRQSQVEKRYPAFTFDISLSPSLICTFHTYCPLLSNSASAGTPLAGKQHRAASRAGIVWLVISGPAWPQQKSPPHPGSIVPQTARQPAGAPCYRWVKRGGNSCNTLCLTVTCHHSLRLTWCQNALKNTSRAKIWNIDTGWECKTTAKTNRLVNKNQAFLHIFYTSESFTQIKNP